jgi:hypothetical protein
MSHNPFEPAQTHDRWDGPTEPQPAAVDALGAPPAAPGTRSNRGLLIGLVVGILAIVGTATVGAVLVYAKVAGGGPQPESVMPSSVIAFAKVDLDPSGGQKIDAIRFARKFPDARSKVSENSDLRKVLITKLQEDGALKGVSYQRDIEPWLGDRVGVGLLPAQSGTAPGAKPVPLIALAVTDRDAATKSLPKVAGSLHGECRVLEHYALCAGSGADLASIVADAARGTLEKSPSFSRDMGDLGEDGVAAAWADTAALTHASSSMVPFGAMGLPGVGTAPVGGRVAVALRFAGANLELAGHVSSMSVSGSHTFVRDTGVGALPRDTLVAVGVAGAGDQFRTTWPQLQSQLQATMGAAQFKAAVAQVQSMIGIKIPGDVAKALGSQTAVAFGGMGAEEQPRIAVVTNGDRAVLAKLSRTVGLTLGTGQLAVKASGQRTVVSLSQDYADEVAGLSGLGDTPAFRAAVPDAATAQATAYVDIAGLLDAFKGDASADTVRNLAPLQAFGASVTSQGTSADFRLRLTTK